MRARRTALLAAVLLGAPAACGPALKLGLIEHSVRRPSNVAVYFTVDRRDGEPVPGLTAEQFRIYEDDRIVSQYESKQTILQREVAAVHYTLLLVDLSGSVTGSGQTPQLQAAAQAFTSRVGRSQRVGIYAFDGAAELHPLVPLAGAGGGADAGVAAMGRFASRDPSTNLHGGVLQAVRVLDRALDQATQPLRFGTLVVFTDGTDRANRVSRDAMLDALEGVDFDVFAIGVGAEIDRDELATIGRTGTVLEADPAAVQRAFDEVARRIEGYTQRYYLLSYCSPARAGAHKLTIEAATPDGAVGALEDGFDAAGFAPGCDPGTPPPFDTSLRRRPRGRRVGQPGR